VLHTWKAGVQLAPQRIPGARRCTRQPAACLVGIAASFVELLLVVVFRSSSPATNLGRGSAGSVH
jgi:hypothetical protein